MITASRILENTTHMSGMALGGHVLLLRLLVGSRAGPPRAVFVVLALYDSLQSHRLPRLFLTLSQQ